MPTYTFELKIADNGALPPHITVRALDMETGAKGVGLSFEDIFSLYSEASEHERHYSNVRMAATSLLFTLAVAVVASYWNKIVGAENLIEGLYYVSMPAILLISSLGVNYYYCRISGWARRLEQHLENLMKLKAENPSFEIAELDGLFFRTFERSQRKGSKLPAPLAQPSTTKDFVENFDRAIKGKHRIDVPFLDGPFYLVALTSLAMCLLLAFYLTNPLKGNPSEQGVFLSERGVQQAASLLDRRNTQAQIPRLQDLERDLESLRAQRMPNPMALADPSQKLLEDIAASLRSLASRQAPAVSPSLPEAVP